MVPLIIDKSVQAVSPLPTDAARKSLFYVILLDNAHWLPP